MYICSCDNRFQGYQPLSSFILETWRQHSILLNSVSFRSTVSCSTRYSLMELFTSNFSTNILNYSPWRPSISASFSKTPFLQLRNEVSKSLKLRFFPPPFHLLHPLQISPTSCRFAASPASSPSPVDLDPMTDNLPADLEISETQEPNSSVSSF